MTIYKYPLLDVELQEIELPFTAKILDVQIQFGQKVLWALVDPLNPPQKYRIGMYLTGQDVPFPSGDHIATLQQAGGGFILHVFAGAV